MIEQWLKIYNMHKDKPPDWTAFKLQYRHFEKGSNTARCEPPTAEALFERAKANKEDVAAGLDGWRPYELRFLPLEAWEIRAQILKIFVKVGRYPETYYYVMYPLHTYQRKTKETHHWTTAC